MKVKTPDTTIISGNKVEFKAQCSTYTMEKDIFKFCRKLESGSLEFDMDYSDNTPCVYDTNSRKITAGGKNITAKFHYKSNYNDKKVEFALLLLNQKTELSNEDYITFTQDLNDNGVMVRFKNTTSETKLRQIKGLPKINFQLNHEYEILFSKENDFFIIIDETTNNRLYHSIEGDEIGLSGSSSATIFDEQYTLLL
jgi:hypothetical protein